MTAIDDAGTAVTIPAATLLALTDPAAAAVVASPNPDPDLRGHVTEALVALAVQAPDELAAHLDAADDHDLEDLVAQAVTEALR